MSLSSHAALVHKWEVALLREVVVCSKGWPSLKGTILHSGAVDVLYVFQPGARQLPEAAPQV